MKSRIFKDKFLLIIILLFAGFLRLYKIADYMTFLGDEGRDVLIVYNILHGHFTLLGPTASVGGFFLGPIYYYFMVPFLWLFNYDPSGPAVMVALFGIATVGLIYKVGSEFFNPKVGFIAAFFYSISPLIIAYSRSSWNPNLMPFFALVLLYVVYKALQKNKLGLFLLGGFLLGISMQLHYLSLFLGVIVGVYILAVRIFEQEKDYSQKAVVKIASDYVFAILGFIIGWLPFLAFEARHGFTNIGSILSFVFKSGNTGENAHFFSTVYNVFFRLFARLVTNFPPPEQVSLQAHTPIAIWYYATLLFALLSTYLLLRQFIKSFKDLKNFKKFSLLLLWLILGVGLFGFYKKPIYDYYFGFMFPLPFLLVGNSLFYLFNQNKIFKIIAVISFILIFWTNIRSIPFISPPNRQPAQVREISKFVLSKSDNKPFNFALITGGNSDHAYRYFFTLWNKPQVTIENDKNDPQRKTVTEQLLIVCEINPCHPLGNSLWEVAGFGRAEIVGEWNVSVVKVFKLVHYKRK